MWRGDWMDGWMHDGWRMSASSLHLQVLDSASAALFFPPSWIFYFLLLGWGSRPRAPSVLMTDNFITTFPFSFLPLFSPSFLLFYFFVFSCRNQMGNLLKVLTCTELEQGPNFFLDFESEHTKKRKKIPPELSPASAQGSAPFSRCSIHLPY